MTVKIDHINLTVSDLKQSVAWYKNVFGFELVESGVTPSGIKWGIVSFDDSMVCMSEYPQKKPADQTAERESHRIYHFGIRISNLNEWHETIKQNNLKIYYGGEIEYPSSRSWYIHDPSGHEIEVSFAENGKLQFPGTEARS